MSHFFPTLNPAHNAGDVVSVTDFETLPDVYIESGKKPSEWLKCFIDYLLTLLSYLRDRWTVQKTKLVNNIID